jgi:hypothetical protein
MRTGAARAPTTPAGLQGEGAAAAELWARLDGLPAVAASFVAVFTHGEMRAMLGVKCKNESKAKLAQRLEQMAAASRGSFPNTSSTTAAARRRPPARAQRRGEDIGEEDPPQPTQLCTQTLARGWYTPKCTSGSTAAATQAGIKTGDVVWCKLGGAPWWPALVAVRTCPRVRLASPKHLAFTEILVACAPREPQAPRLH